MAGAMALAVVAAAAAAAAIRLGATASSSRSCGLWLTLLSREVTGAPAIFLSTNIFAASFSFISGLTLMQGVVMYCV